MDNYFLQNPIKINILKIDENNISNNYKIIFLGNIPKNIKNNVLNFNKKTSPNILKKYYGNNWNSKLELFDEKIGGDDKDIITSEDLIDFNDFHLDILDESIEPNETDIKHDIHLIESENINIDIAKSKILYNTDVFIYPEDNIKILKEKIFLVTKIQIYEQNLSLHNYTLYIEKLKYDITFSNIFQLNKIKKIPIDNYLYDNRDYIQINSNEFESLYSYFKEFGQIECNILPLSEFIPDKQELQNIVKTDRQQTDMIYYSFIIKYYPLFSYEVFQNYILHYDDIKNIYPDLHLNYNNIKNKYDIENKIIDEHNQIDDKELTNFIKNEFSLSIIEREFIIEPVNKLNKINIRNLFDNIEIKSINNLNYIKANIFINNKEVILKKINNKSVDIDDTIIIDNNSLLLNIKVDYKKFNIYLKDHIYMNLIINESGKSILKVSFKDLFEINKKQLFELIDSIVNPIIKNINSSLVKTDKALTIITEYNTTINNSIVNILWNNEISLKGFNILIIKLKDYINAGIINIKIENLINNEIEYSINKGMIKFNDKAIDKYIELYGNYYLYYSNGDIKVIWNRIFTNSKTILIKNKINNLKIELRNITETELDYISNILYKCLLINKKQILIKDEDTKTTSLKFLKQTDPKLFVIKDPKTDKDIYSRKCQKKLQPVIVKKSFINEQNKDSIIKFWNFTKNKEEYYHCPNKSFPFVKFLTNIHPNNYCVPCCKKKDMSSLDETSKSKLIYDKCIKEYVYDIKSSDTDKSRYIMTYGKELEINRLMVLPNELQRIINSNIEKESEQYYLYGSHQNKINISNIGILFILSEINDLTVEEYIKKIVQFLKDNNYIFTYLLNGTIIYHFSSLDELLIYIVNVFIHNKLNNHTFNLWNELFIDIAKYMGINILIIRDHASLEIDIPKNTKYLTDIFPENIETQYVIILNKEDNLKNQLFYPIYFINPKKHFKNHTISKKIYNNEDKIISNIKQIYNYYLSQVDNIVRILDLVMVDKFIKYNKRYEIFTYYINSNNKCYALLLKYNNKKFIYISIQESSIDMKNINISDKMDFSIVEINTLYIDINTILEFTENYNNFIYTLLIDENILDNSMNKILISDIKEYNKLSTNSFNFDVISSYKYEFLRIDKFIEFDKKIIGVICNDLYFYNNPELPIATAINIIKNQISNTKKNITGKTNLKLLLTRSMKLTHQNSGDDINKLYIKKIIYHPIEINNLILNKTQVMHDHRTLSRDKSLYNTYLYPLILLQFQKEFSTYQNIRLRSIIKNSINNLKPSELITSYFKTKDNKIYNCIEKYFIKLYKDIHSYKDELNNSYSILDKIIIFYLNKNISNIKELKKLILLEIDNNKFPFDQLFIIDFKLMRKNDLIKKLHQLSKNLFTIKENYKFNNEISFPNIILPCKEDTSMSYCDKNKLIISKSNLDMYLNILAGDIYNPIKSQYIFSSFFVQNNINLFTFKNYPNEKIFIS